jgi:hypothetical protein
MRVTITDAAQTKAIWEAAKQDGDAPASLTLIVAKADEVRECACGCGGSTAKTWVPGHDAKHKSRLFALVRGGGEQAKLAKAELTRLGWPLPATKAEAKPLPLPAATA